MKKTIMFIITVMWTAFGFAQMQIGTDINGEAADDGSGNSVSLNSEGTFLAIGASGNDGNGSGTGHVRVFTLDTDNDGINDAFDADVNGDGTVDNGTDTDGDGINDANDSNINNVDTDGDGIPDGADVDTSVTSITDIDGDAIQDGADADIGNDGITDTGKTDTDGDGVIDLLDPINNNSTNDTDSDGIPDPADVDRDNDGAHDNGTDSDGDGINDFSDIDNLSQIGSRIDGEATGDEFSGSIAFNTDGTIAAISGHLNDDAGVDSGHVRVYQNISGNWMQIGSNIDGEAIGDLFGRSLALSADGSILAVGANLNNGNGFDSGHVRVYQNMSGVWTQIGSDIDGEAAGDLFGRSIALSTDGTILAVGAPFNGNPGHVRVYQNNAGTWTQIGTDIEGEAAGDQFGISVTLSADGSILAVGASGNDGNGSGAGHVRVYQNMSGTWTQIGTDIEGEAAGDLFGRSISLSADGTILAGTGLFNDENGTNSGHVRIYRNISGIWTQIGADIDGEAAGDQFGFSISLSADGNIVAIGANGNDGNGANSGHVRVYQNISDTWTQIGSDIDGETAGDNAGIAILSADGSTLGIGAFLHDGVNGVDSGCIRLFAVSTDTNGDGIRDNIPVPTSLSLKAFLQGPYNTSSGMMNDNLRTAGVIPTTSPYADAATVANTSVFDNANDADDIVDWVYVELRSKNNISSVLHATSALLQRDGDIVGLDGTSTLQIASGIDDFFVSVTHRNHISIATDAVRSISTTSTTTIDFTNSTGIIRGNSNALNQVSTGIFAMIAGDALNSSSIETTDVTNALQVLGTSGYITNDIDLNGSIETTDVTLILSLIGRGIQF